MKCPMCHADLVDAVPRQGYCTCHHCGGFSLHPYPSEQSNTVFEGPEGVARQQALEESRQRYFLRHLLRIEKQIGRTVQNWRLMEIGCGSGVLLRTAWGRGWQADALELSPAMAALARRASPKATIREIDALQYTEGRAEYDAVLALDVLEHVLDPALLLRNCWALLKPGGLLLLQTPNTRSLRSRLQGESWAMRDPEQHLNLFSPRGIRGLLAETGFVVVSMHTVSGSGRERGWRRVMVAVMERALDLIHGGNALCVLARKGA